MEKASKSKLKRFIVPIVIAAVAVAVCIFLFTEVPALHSVVEYRQMFSDTVITVDDEGVEIVPENAADADQGIVFYVGAKIRPEAYIPLMARIAEEGYCCYIPKIPCNIAFFEADAARPIIDRHSEISSWYLAGHSLGGLVASEFANDNPGQVDGIILLAAYLNIDMSGKDMPSLFIYGDNDGVFNMNLYNERSAWVPSDCDEFIIFGANHAQFGDYGKQLRDNDAAISAEDQQIQTADKIVRWLGNQ